MKTTVDWLRFRTLSDPYETLDAIRPAFGTAADLLTLEEGGKGKDGWESRKILKMAGDLTLGYIDHGGESQRGWLRFDLPGTGCEWIQDWSYVAGTNGRLDTAELRRIDLALTVFDGSVTHEKVIEAHSSGYFSCGGRSPKLKQITGSDPKDGRTVYVGARESEKFVRCYEKGYELLAKHKVPEWIKKSANQLYYDGVGTVDIDKLYRCEVEFKASATKVLPWTMITNGDAYFAGANPFFASLLPGAKERRIQTMPDFGPKVALQVQAENLRKAYGGVIKALMASYNDDADFVIKMLSADAPSERLIKDGVLTVLHQ